MNSPLLPQKCLTDYLSLRLTVLDYLVSHDRLFWQTSGPLVVWATGWRQDRQKQLRHNLLLSIIYWLIFKPMDFEIALVRELPCGHCFAGWTLLGFSTFEFNNSFINTTRFQHFCIQHILYSTLLLFNKHLFNTPRIQQLLYSTLLDFNNHGFNSTQFQQSWIQHSLFSTNLDSTILVFNNPLFFFFTLVTWLLQNRQGKLHLSLRGVLRTPSVLQESTPP